MDIQYLNYFKASNGYEIGGVWYPRVTAICKIISKPGLESWFAKQGSVTAMREKRKKITDFGHLIHETAGKILMGESPQIGPNISPCIDALTDWLGSRKVRAWDIERRTLSREHFFAGTIDVLAEIDGHFGILDIKTSERIWDDYFLQTAAYFEAHNEENAKKVQTHWILRIDQYEECKNCGAKKRDKGGEVAVKEGFLDCFHEWSPAKGVCELQEVKNHKIYFDGFLRAKALWNWVNRDFLAQIENYPKNFLY